jgi:hypothetical protein
MWALWRIQGKYNTKPFTFQKVAGWDFMKQIEKMIERMPGIEKWAVDILKVSCLRSSP